MTTLKTAHVMPNGKNSTGIEPMLAYSNPLGRVGEYRLSERRTVGGVKATDTVYVYTYKLGRT